MDKNKNDLFELGYKSGVNSGELAFAIKIYSIVYFSPPKSRYMLDLVADSIAETYCHFQ